jgi:hypothetical protein
LSITLHPPCMACYFVVWFTQIYLSRSGCEIRATEFVEVWEYIDSSTPYHVCFCLKPSNGNVRFVFWTSQKYCNKLFKSKSKLVPVLN